MSDDRNYTVIGINGFRRGSLTEQGAVWMASKMQEEMRVAGWRGEMRVVYRDGSEVDWRALIEDWRVKR